MLNFKTRPATPAISQLNRSTGTPAPATPVAPATPKTPLTLTQRAAFCELLMDSQVTSCGCNIIASPSLSGKKLTDSAALQKYLKDAEKHRELASSFFFVPFQFFFPT